jgi:hypothetical protein
MKKKDQNKSSGSSANESSAVVVSPQKYTLDAIEGLSDMPRVVDESIFDSIEGEIFSGLDLLKLKQNQASAPMVYLRKLPAREISKKYPGKLVETSVAQRVNEAGLPIGGEIQLPASTALIMKIDEAKLKAGDIFAIKRVEDYTSRAGRTDCQAYVLKVIKRS